MIKTVNLIVSIGRIFGHNLEMENNGQYKIPRKNRICKQCLL